MNNIRTPLNAVAGSQPVKSAPIQEALKINASLRQDLEIAIGRLHDRLEPVMGAPAPQTADGGVNPRSPGVLGEIEEASTHVQAMFHRVVSLIDRLQV
jgi:hypothetical protein